MLGFSKKKKKLIAIGCSWTHEYYKSIVDSSAVIDYLKWPAIVGNQLDIEVVNMGMSGDGNERILSKLTDYLHESHDDVYAVMILWSGQTRVNVIDTYSWNFMAKAWKNLIADDLKDDPKNKSMMKDNENFLSVSRYMQEIFHSGGYKNLPNMFQRNIFTAQVLCDSYGIPLIQMSGIPPLSAYIFNESQLERAGLKHIYNDSFKDKYNDYLQKFLESRYYDWIEENTNYIGWPVYEELGGYSADYGLFKDEKIKRLGVESKYRVSALDLHPNKLGHETIANAFIEEIKKVI